MRVKKKLVLSSLLLSILALVLLAGISMALLDLVGQKRRSDAVHSISRTFSDLRAVTHDFLRSSTEALEAEWQHRFRLTQASVALLPELPAGTGSDLAQIASEISTLPQLFSVVATTTREPRGGTRANLGEQGSSLLKRIEMLEFRARDMVEQNQTTWQQTLRMTVSLIGSLLILLVVGGILALVFVAHVGREVNGLLTQLMEGTRRLGEGDLSHRIKFAKESEFQQIATAFNEMAERLSEETVSLDTLRAESARRQKTQVDLSRQLAYTELLADVALVASENKDPHLVFQASLKTVCEHLHWEIGHVYYPDPRNEYVLLSSTEWELKDPDMYSMFRVFTENTNLAKGIGLPGRCYASGKPSIVPVLSEDPNFPRSKVAEECGLCVGMAFPVLVGAEVVAVLEFFKADPALPDNALLEVMGSIGTYLGRVVERTRAEAEIKRRGIMLERAEEIAHVGSWEWDVTNDEIQWSNELCRIYGLESVQSPRTYASFLAILPTETAQKIDACVRKALSTGEGYDHIHSILRGDGVERFTRARGQPLAEGKDRIVRMAGTAQDVTESVRNERALKESEERFRALADAAFEPVALHEGGRFVGVNEPFLKMFGFRKAWEVIGKTYAELTAVGSEGSLWSKIPWESDEMLELKGSHADGVELVVEVRGRTTWYNGRQARVTALRDITAPRVAVQRLNEEKERTRLLLDQMPAIVWTVDKNLTITSSMGAGLALLNHQPGQLKGVTIEEYSGAGSPALQQHRDALAGRSVSSETLWQERYLSSHIEPLRGEDGEILGAVGVSIDITDLKKAEIDLALLAQQLARSNRDLEEFAEVVAHDLREPLRMVTCYLRLLERRYGEQLDPGGVEFIAFAVDGAHRMKRFLSDLFEYSRVGSGHHGLQLTSTEEILAGVIRGLKVRIEEKGAKIKWATLPSVMAEPMMLGQVFQNLIANALKFCEARAPDIEITAERKTGYWEFRVADNGIGIPAEAKDRIFLIFQRLQSTYPGTGMGLAVCKKVIERHGGRIWVESETGVGSIFHFTLPIVAEESRRGIPSASREKTG